MWQKQFWVEVRAPGGVVLFLPGPVTLGESFPFLRLLCNMRDRIRPHLNCHLVLTFCDSLQFQPHSPISASLWVMRLLRKINLIVVWVFKSLDVFPLVLRRTTARYCMIWTLLTFTVSFHPHFSLHPMSDLFSFSGDRFFFFLVSLGPHPWHMEVLRLGVKLELQPPAYATAIATGDLSCV